MPRAKKRPPPEVPTARESAVMASVAQVCRLFGVEIERQNTGGMTNDRGRYVAFGVAGNSDLTGMTDRSWGDRAGLKVDIETKREGWDIPPHPAPGEEPTEERARFDKQIARLRRTNANGGFGFWTDDVSHATEVLRLLKSGECVAIEIPDDELCWLVPAGGEL